MLFPVMSSKCLVTSETMLFHVLFQLNCTVYHVYIAIDIMGVYESGQPMMDGKGYW